MSDQYVPKFTRNQRTQIEAALKELTDTVAESLFSQSDVVSNEAKNNARELLNSPTFPWIAYLEHVISDGQKGNPVRSPAQRIAAAKKIKRRTKRTPRINDLKTLHSLMSDIDDRTGEIIDEDLRCCCSDLPPSLWARRRKLHP